MLVLGRKKGEAIDIVVTSSTGEVTNLTVIVREQHLNGARLGIEAPANVKILRRELVESNQ